MYTSIVTAEILGLLTKAATTRTIYRLQFLQRERSSCLVSTSCGNAAVPNFRQQNRNQSLMYSWVTQITWCQLENKNRIFASRPATYLYPKSRRRQRLRLAGELRCSSKLSYIDPGKPSLRYQRQRPNCNNFLLTPLRPVERREWGSFPGPRHRSKYWKDVPDAFCLISNTHNIHFGSGFPQTKLESLRCSPDSQSDGDGGNPSASRSRCMRNKVVIKPCENGFRSLAVALNGPDNTAH